MFRRPHTRRHLGSSSRAYCTSKRNLLYIDPRLWYVTPYRLLVIPTPHVDRVESTQLAQADVSNPDIKDAYEKVRNDKDDTTWLLLDFEGDKSDKLALTETGTGVSLQSRLQPARGPIRELTRLQATT